MNLNKKINDILAPTVMDDVFDMIKEGVDKRFYPSAVFAVGDKDGILRKEAYGYPRWFSDDAPCFDVTPKDLPQNAKECTINTMYDMASCSKVLGTTMLGLKAIENGEMTLMDTVGRFFPDAPDDKKNIDILDLMTHRSGYAPWFDLSALGYEPCDAVKALLSVPLQYKMGTEVKYSCMGYILFGKILEEIYGAPLDVAAEKYVFSPLGMKNTMYTPLKRGYTGDIAPTEYDEKTKKYKCGIVHDENACFLEGVSGNAGVFSTIDDIAKLCTSLVNYDFLTKRTMDKVWHNYTEKVPGEDRGLGFELNGHRFSSAGDLFSYESIGHTGFTGTFLFIDKETSFFTILLTNRVHFTRANNLMLRHRRKTCNRAVTEYFKLKCIK